MSYEEFWEGDLSLPKFYREAEKIRAKRERDETNFKCWLQGLYNHEAFSCTIANAFRKKNAQSVKYMEKPIEFADKEKEEDPIEVEKRKENEALKFQVQMNNLAKMFDYLPKD
jgi:hypothetical protein